jgi:hypothetical protein
MAALPPKVFLSYSHDSTEHDEHVLALADDLRAGGIDVRLDQYVDNPTEGWPRWMERQVVECDFVLLVCTPTYRRRFNREDTGEGGKGAKWEGMILEQLLYEAQANNQRLVPVLFEGGKEEDVPLVLRAYTRYRLLGEYEKLYRRLTGQQEIKAPPIGTIRPMPPRQRPGLSAVVGAGAVTHTGSTLETGGAVLVDVDDEALIAALAEAFSDPDDARRLARKAGFPTGRIPVFRVPELFWHSLVEAANNGAIRGKARALADAAVEFFPSNDVFMRYRPR